MYLNVRIYTDGARTLSPRRLSRRLREAPFFFHRSGVRGGGRPGGEILLLSPRSQQSFILIMLFTRSPLQSAADYYTTIRAITSINILLCFTLEYFACEIIVIQEGQVVVFRIRVDRNGGVAKQTRRLSCSRFVYFFFFFRNNTQSWTHFFPLFLSLLILFSTCVDKRNAILTFFQTE